MHAPCSRDRNFDRFHVLRDSRPLTGDESRPALFGPTSVHLEDRTMGKTLLSSRRIAIVVAVLVLVLVAPTLSMAQSNTGVCRSLVASGLASVGPACANLGGGEACFGNPDLEIETFEPLPADAFAEAGDRTDLTNVIEIRTLPANTSDRTMGVTVLNIQANVPRTLSDGGLIVVAMGGMIVENGVFPQDAFVPLEEGLTVTTVSAAEYREATMTPPANAEVLGTIPAGQNLVADALSEDGNWVRVIFDDMPVWAARSALDPAAAFDTLPVFGPNSLTSLQSFFFLNEAGPLQCSDAPALLLVQGRQDYPIDVRIGNVDLRIQGTIALNIVGNTFEIIALNGMVTVEPDTANEFIIPAGFRARIELGEPAELGTDGRGDEWGLVGNWSTPSQLTQNDLDLLRNIQTLPGNLLNFPIVFPRIVRPSGIGGAAPQIILNDPFTRAIIQEACAEGKIPDFLCAVFGF